MKGAQGTAPAESERSRDDDPLTASGRPLRLAKQLRFQRALLSALLVSILGGSVAAIGAVHPESRLPLFGACGLLAVVAGASLLTARALRAQVGEHVVQIHPGGRWITLHTVRPSRASGFVFDLARPLLPRAPLLLPGLAFVLLVLLQLVPLPASVADALSPGTRQAGAEWRSLTLSAEDSLLALGYLVAALLVHFAARVAFAERAARERVQQAIAVVALVVALVALGQLSSGTERVFGLFTPREGGHPYGPFVNRNHFATWMLVAGALCFALLDGALRAFRRRTGPDPNVRRRIVALQSTEGITLVYALLPAAAAVASLLASTSRGGILAFGFALVLALAGRRRSRGVPVWAVALVFVAMTLSWFGAERLGARFERMGNDAPGRTLVWKDTLSRMQGLWLTGSGFGTFGLAMGRVTAWQLPEGATPWPADVGEELRSGARVGYRTTAELRDLSFYREAHNDYVQVLAETGVLGLGLALWAAVAALLAVRRNPWAFAAVAGVLLHAIVDFGLQIPAVALLFVTVAALGQERD